MSDVKRGPLSQLGHDERRVPPMTLREYYAGLAMQGLLSAQIHGFNDQPANGPFAEMSVGMADALIAALQDEAPA